MFPHVFDMVAEQHARAASALLPSNRDEALRTIQRQQAQIDSLKRENDILSSQAGVNTKAPPSATDRQEVEQLRVATRAVSTYRAKLAAEQQLEAELADKLAVSAAKVAELRRELAAATGNADATAAAGRAAKKLEERLSLVQQRLNQVLAENRVLHEQIDKVRDGAAALRIDHDEASAKLRVLLEDVSQMTEQLAAEEELRSEAEAAAAALHAQMAKEQAFVNLKLAELSKLREAQQQLQVLSLSHSTRAATAPPPPTEQELQAAFKELCQHMGAVSAADAAQVLLDRHASNYALFCKVSEVDESIAKAQEELMAAEAEARNNTAFGKDNSCHKTRDLRVKSLQEQTQKMQIRRDSLLASNAKRSSMLRAVRNATAQVLEQNEHNTVSVSQEPGAGEATPCPLDCLRLLEERLHTFFSDRANSQAKTVGLNANADVRDTAQCDAPAAHSSKLTALDQAAPEQARALDVQCGVGFCTQPAVADLPPAHEQVQGLLGAQSTSGMPLQLPTTLIEDGDEDTDNDTGD